MPRPQSRFLRILNQIEADIKKITIANGYVTDFGPDSVSMLPTKELSYNIFPACFITYKGKTKTELQNSRGSKKTKIVRLIFFLRDSLDKETIRQIADLETDIDWLWRENNPTLIEDSTGEELVTKIKMVNDETYKVSGVGNEVWMADMEITFHEKWNF